MILSALENRLRAGLV